MAGGARREWLKPVMFSGGIGSLDTRHVAKEPPQIGAWREHEEIASNAALGSVSWDTFRVVRIWRAEFEKRELEKRNREQESEFNGYKRNWNWKKWVGIKSVL